MDAKKDKKSTRPVTKKPVSISSFAILSANMPCLTKCILFISVQRPTFFARSPLCDRVITNFETIIVKMSLFKRLFSKRLLLSVIEERYIVSIPYLFISFLQRLLLSPVFYLISFLFNNNRGIKSLLYAKLSLQILQGFNHWR
jgi:hypothetical protein